MIKERRDQLPDPAPYEIWDFLLFKVSGFITLMVGLVEVWLNPTLMGRSWWLVSLGLAAVGGREFFGKLIGLVKNK